MSQSAYAINLSASGRPRLVKDAIILGKDTVLARQVVHQGCLYVERPDEAGLSALLSVAYGKRISVDDSLPRTIVKAGDLMIRSQAQAADLLVSLLEPLPDIAERLALADGLLKSGTHPAELDKAMRRAPLGLLPVPAYAETLWLCDQGVVLGKGTVIAALVDLPAGGTGLAIEGREGRILALLSVAQDQPAAPEALRKLDAVSRALARGETALAALTLCQIGQPSLPHNGFAKALDLAARELDRGSSSYDLLKGLGLLPKGMGYGAWEKLAKSRNGEPVTHKEDKVTVTASGWDESKHPRNHDDGRWVDRGNSDAKPLDNSTGPTKITDKSAPASSRKFSKNGVEFLARKEDFSPKVYTDSAGNDTIGYGHKLLPGESFPNGITEEQAQQLLASDAAKAEADVRKAVKVNLTEAQYDALVSFAYNVGGSAFSSSSLVKKLNAGDSAGAADEFLKWNKIKNKNGQLEVNQGLTNRRNDERKLFVGGEYK